MSFNNSIPLVDYGLVNALQQVFPAPIVANRAPTAADKAQIGQQWVQPSSNSVWFLASIVNNSATWVDVAGGSGSFSSLTVTPGPISLTGTTTINTTGSASTAIGSTNGGSGIIMAVGTGNFSLDGNIASVYTVGSSTTTGTITIGGTAQTGAITLGSSTGTNIVNVGTGTGATTVNIATGITNAKTIHIADGAVANVVTVGSTSGAASTTINAGSLGVTIGGAFMALPGPVYVYTGSGAPSNGLALHAGDLYINTSASTTTTRLYIATGAGAWTYFTSNA